VERNARKVAALLARRLFQREATADAVPPGPAQSDLSQAQSGPKPPPILDHEKPVEHKAQAQLDGEPVEGSQMQSEVEEGQMEIDVGYDAEISDNENEEDEDNTEAERSSPLQNEDELPAAHGEQKADLEDALAALPSPEVTSPVYSSGSELTELSDSLLPPPKYPSLTKNGDKKQKRAATATSLPSPPPEMGSENTTIGVDREDEADRDDEENKTDSDEELEDYVSSDDSDVELPDPLQMFWDRVDNAVPYSGPNRPGQNGNVGPGQGPSGNGSESRMHGTNVVLEAGKAGPGDGVRSGNDKTPSPEVRGKANSGTDPKKPVLESQREGIIGERELSGTPELVGEKAVMDRTRSQHSPLEPESPAAGSSYETADEEQEEGHGPTTRSSTLGSGVEMDAALLRAVDGDVMDLDEESTNPVGSTVEPMGGTRYNTRQSKKRRRYDNDEVDDDKVSEEDSASEEDTTNPEPKGSAVVAVSVEENDKVAEKANSPHPAPSPAGLQKDEAEIQVLETQLAETFPLAWCMYDMDGSDDSDEVDLVRFHDAEENVEIMEQ
jgi:hypothetical protein